MNKKASRAVFILRLWRVKNGGGCVAKYTTGEIAKLVGVSVRTVQSYDSRGILIPSELSEGGRRLYSEEDLKRMRIICFLRDAGLSINGIAEIFSDETPRGIIDSLLEEQKRTLLSELSEREEQLKLIEDIKKGVRESENFSLDSIGDIAYISKTRGKLNRMHAFMIISGIPVSLLQWAGIILWIATGAWWLFALYVGVGIAWGIAVSRYYFRRTSYVCPECHEVFKPKLREAFFAYHTPRMRKLRCPRCERHGLCIEVYNDKKENI